MTQKSHTYYTDLAHLHLMEAMHYRRRPRLSAGASLFIALPLIAFSVMLLLTLAPETEFLAQCHNIPNGDICTITLNKF
jgi:hypothetical protein